VLEIEKEDKSHEGLWGRGLLPLPNKNKSHDATTTTMETKHNKKGDTTSHNQNYKLKRDSRAAWQIFILGFVY